MLQSRHIVVADYSGGTTKTLYQGPDVVKAEKAMAACIAEGKASAVVLFHHPVPGQIRYPAQEKLDIARRQAEAEASANAAAQKATREALLKRDQAKILMLQAKQLEEQAAKHLDSETDKDK